MNTETKAALDAAIGIWERRAKGESVDEYCPLCIRFNCRECPIDAVTTGGCFGTPVFRWVRYDNINENDSPAAREWARQETEFLKAIRLGDPVLIEFYVRR